MSQMQGAFIFYQTPPDWGRCRGSQTRAPSANWICISPGGGENGRHQHASAIVKVRSCCFMHTVCRRFFILLALCAGALPAPAGAATVYKLAIAPAGGKVRHLLAGGGHELRVAKHP